MVKVAFGRLAVWIGAVSALGCAGSSATTAGANGAEPARSPAQVPSARTEPLPGSLQADRRLFEQELAAGDAFREAQQLQKAELKFRSARIAAERHPELWVEFANASLRVAELIGEVDPGGGAAILEPALELSDRLGETEPAARRVYGELDAKYAELRKREWPLKFKRLMEEFGGIGRELSENGELRSIAPQDVFAPMNPPPKAGSTTAGEMTNGKQVVAAMRLDLRHCYQEGLKLDPDAAGNVFMALAVGNGGTVTRARATGRGLPESTLDCMLRVAAGLRFDGRGSLTVPMTFIKN
jgi:hypothetical protein